MAASDGTCLIGISIHALHEESDGTQLATSKGKPIFQSTLSMRRATGLTNGCTAQRRISIHALHEESDRGHRRTGHGPVISIHALHEESDCTRPPVT